MNDLSDLVGLRLPRAPLKPLTHTMLPRTGDTIRGRVEAIDADGVPYHADFAITETLRRAMSYSAFADAYAASVEKAAREVARRMEARAFDAVAMAVSPAITWSPAAPGWIGTTSSTTNEIMWNRPGRVIAVPPSEDLKRLVTNISPWEMPILDNFYGTGTIRREPARSLEPRKIEPVPLGELADMAKQASRDEAKRAILEVLAA